MPQERTWGTTKLMKNTFAWSSSESTVKSQNNDPFKVHVCLTNRRTPWKKHTNVSFQNEVKAQHHHALGVSLECLDKHHKWARSWLPAVFFFFFFYLQSLIIYSSMLMPGITANKSQVYLTQSGHFSILLFVSETLSPYLNGGSGQQVQLRPTDGPCRTTWRGSDTIPGQRKPWERRIPSGAMFRFILACTWAYKMKYTVNPPGFTTVLLKHLTWLSSLGKAKPMSLTNM